MPLLAVMTANLVGRHDKWSGKYVLGMLILAAVAAFAAVAIPRITGILAVLGLVVIGAYGVLLPVFWPAAPPSRMYGLVTLTDTAGACWPRRRASCCSCWRGWRRASPSRRTRSSPSGRSG
ncbi:MAG: hypothetical protein JOY82_16845 [Streptosporangiaceae bacterium]|nr:hypothetical protein [Streptosporangiaceae bacterium]MBV9856161.1 hypothetical protein [Streptosporangiaceae bacterium]